MRRGFVTLDVFTSRRFAGNPLAVVLDAEGLATDAMQSVAREFNLPETVFLSPPANAAHRARLRIFTPTAELPFAGHPTVGTAVLLAQLDGAKEPRRLVLEEKIGLVQCEVSPRGLEHGHACFLIPQLPQRREQVPDAAAIAAALHLETSEIGFHGFAPSSWSAGLSFVFVPLRSLEAVQRCRPDLGVFDSVFGFGEPGKAYVFCRKTVDAKHAFHARMFAPGMGIPEDPATGSAAAAFAGLLARHDQPADGERRIVIEQGYEMGRPSEIELTMTITGGALTAASIGGAAIVVSEGMIEA